MPATWTTCYRSGTYLSALKDLDHELWWGPFLCGLCKAHDHSKNERFNAWNNTGRLLNPWMLDEHVDTFSPLDGRLNAWWSLQPETLERLSMNTWSPLNTWNALWLFCLLCCCCSGTRLWGGCAATATAFTAPSCSGTWSSSCRASEQEGKRKPRQCSNSAGYGRSSTTGTCCIVSHLHTDLYAIKWWVLFTMELQHWTIRLYYAADTLIGLLHKHCCSCFLSYSVQTLIPIDA